MIKGLRHIGLVVKDAQMALSFYQELLGFKVDRDKIETGIFIESILAMPSVKIRTIKMKDGNGCVLELLCYDTPALIPSKTLSQSGFTHIALTVEDLDGICIFLKRKGVEFLSSPHVSPDGKAKVVFCRDFEGNFLELVQDLE